MLRGVNLGGWLVLERWMTPSLFEGTEAVDEFGYCAAADRKSLTRLRQHRDTFITEGDFEWLKERGIDAVRIPVGYWAFGDAGPYDPTIGYLDRAFAWAEETGVRVLISIHGAPGSQNGADHSGCQGPVGWQADRSNITGTLEMVRRLARRYRTSPALLGIGLLNEPSKQIPKQILKQYYRRAYAIVRQECGPDTWVVISDRFEPEKWRAVLPRYLYRNVYLDTHQYQAFSQADKDMPADGHIRYTLSEVALRLNRMRRYHPVAVGEWSAALDPRSLRGLTPERQQTMQRAYCQAQLQMYDRMDAWFYWNYKTEQGGPWSFRDCYGKGWFDG